MSKMTMIHIGLFLAGVGVGYYLLKK